MAANVDAVFLLMRHAFDTMGAISVAYKTGGGAFGCGMQPLAGQEGFQGSAVRLRGSAPEVLYEKRLHAIYREGRRRITLPISSGRIQRNPSGSFGTPACTTSTL